MKKLFGIYLSGLVCYLNGDPVIPAPNQKLNRPDLPCAECTGSDLMTAAEAEYFADILTNGKYLVTLIRQNLQY